MCFLIAAILFHSCLLFCFPLIFSSITTNLFEIASHQSFISNFQISQLLFNLILIIFISIHSMFICLLNKIIQSFIGDLISQSFIPLIAIYALKIIVCSCCLIFLNNLIS